MSLEAWEVRDAARWPEPFSGHQLDLPPSSETEMLVLTDMEQRDLDWFRREMVFTARIGMAVIRPGDLTIVTGI